jgi:hypothetical protein
VGCLHVLPGFIDCLDLYIWCLVPGEMEHFNRLIWWCLDGLWYLDEIHWMMMIFWISNCKAVTVLVAIWYII